MTYLGEGRIYVEAQGWEKLYRLTIKLTSSNIVAKDFPYTLRVPSLYFKSTSSVLQVYCITQKIHISQELAFLWFTPQCHET